MSSCRGVVIKRITRWWATRALRRSLVDIRYVVTIAQLDDNIQIRSQLYGFIASAGEFLKDGEVLDAQIGKFLDAPSSATFSKLLSLKRAEWDDNIRAEAAVIARKILLVRQERTISGDNEMLCFGIGFWSITLYGLCFEELFDQVYDMWYMISRNAESTYQFQREQVRMQSTPAVFACFAETSPLLKLRPVYLSVDS